MPSNNSKARKAERRRKAEVRLRLHASNPHGCSRKTSKHTDEEHEVMLNEADRLRSL